MRLANDSRRFLSALAPVVALTLLGLAAFLPWGGGRGHDGFQAPLLLLVPIHYLGVVRADRTAPWLVFLVGLATDVISGGPLGFWALVDLVVLGAAQAIVRHELGAGLLALWGSFAISLLIALTAGHISACIYHWRLIEWSGSLASGALIVCAYPFLAYLLARLISPADELASRGSSFGG